MRRAARWIATGLGAVVAILLAVAGILWLRHYPWPVEPERVVIASGEIELVGALLAPQTGGPHPAIVMLSGSECATHDRLIYRLFANHFVPRGFALLVYDKRGCGESGGDHAAAELPDLVADVRSAVRFLRGRDDIRSDGIGLLGSSQSGWITPEVAVEENVAFVINRSSSPLRWDRTVLFEIENDMRAVGVDEAGIRDILDLRPRIWEYYRRAALDPEYALGPAREALAAEVEAAKRKDWFEHVRIGLAAYDPELYAAWSSTIFYDPMPYLERLRVPLLAVFGETDINVPAAPSAVVLERLAADPRRDFTVVVFPGVGHQLQTWRAWPRIGFLYLDEMAEFAAAAVGRRPAGVS